MKIFPVKSTSLFQPSSLSVLVVVMHPFVTNHQVDHSKLREILNKIAKYRDTRYDGQYAERYTLNSCLAGVVIALPQKRSGEPNGALVDNTEGLSFFGIRDYLVNYCPSLP